MKYDWTPVPAVHGVVTRPRNLPPWNPPPTTFGMALGRHTNSGHRPPPPPPPPPAIASITPNNGPDGGGTSCVILRSGTVTDMSTLTGVQFGGEDGVLGGGNVSQRIVTSPPGDGLVNVTVTGPGGRSNPVQYQYNPADE